MRLFVVLSICFNICRNLGAAFIMCVANVRHYSIIGYLFVQSKPI